MNRRSTRRYIGDLRSMTVHKTVGAAGCGARNIPPAFTAAFRPDTLEQALREGFHACSLCIDRVR